MFIVKVVIFLVCIIGFSFWSKKRNNRLFIEENETRERLGLPQLTRDEFGLKVVEKSADYRGNINQHM